MKTIEKLVILADNRCLEQGALPSATQKTNQGSLPLLKTEHGLSVYVQTPSQTYLLDTGASDVFVHNAEIIGIRLEKIDTVFLSHGHSDHTGGLPYFLNKGNEHADIFVSSNLMQCTYYSSKQGLKEIGRWNSTTPLTVKQRFYYLKEIYESPNGWFIFPCRSAVHPRPKANARLYSDDGMGLQPDSFSHELIFCLQAEKLFVYTGCSHHGLLNILDTVEHQLGRKPDLVVGGFHFPDGNPEQLLESGEELTKLGKQLLTRYPNCRFVTGHCTGNKAYKRLKEVMGDRMESFHVGYFTNL